MQSLRVIVFAFCAVVASVVIGAAFYGLVFVLPWPIADPIILVLGILSWRAVRHMRRRRHRSA